MPITCFCETIDRGRMSGRPPGPGYKITISQALLVLSIMIRWKNRIANQSGPNQHGVNLFGKIYLGIGPRN